LRKFLELEFTGESIANAWVRNEHDSTKGISRESCLSLLGLVLGEQFKFAQAEQVLRQTSDSSEQERGADHPASLTYKNNWLLAVSDLKGSGSEAVDIELTSIDLANEHRQIYEKRVQALGRDHLHTLVTQNNLALELFRQGKQTEALSLMNDCLQKRSHVLGRQHQHVMDTQSNLATFYELTGNTRKAIYLRLDEKELFHQMMPLPPKHLIQAMCVLVCSYLECAMHVEAYELAAELGAALDTMSNTNAQTANTIGSWWSKMLARVNADNPLESKEDQRLFDVIKGIARKTSEEH
jgi:hypothetical protein